LRAVDIDSANADAYYYLALVSVAERCFEDAAQFFAHTLDISPKDIRALRDSAVVYLAMGRLADAAERIREARGLTDDAQIKWLDRRIWLLRTAQRFTDFLGRRRP
jgi:tetratricopeptide (TPR) repeat protein